MMGSVGVFLLDTAHEDCLAGWRVLEIDTRSSASRCAIVERQGVFTRHLVCLLPQPQDSLVC